MMRNIIIFLFAATLFLSCSNVEFICPQPEFLDPLTEIPEKFHGEYVIPEMDTKTYVISNLTIAGDSINNGKFVIKSWGNYLFINEREGEGDTYDLTIGKAVKFLNYETLSIHFIKIDTSQTHLFNIVEKATGGFSAVNYILEDVNRNQFQTLLNNSEKMDVVRVE
jgi:hypothetical protein